MCRSDVGLSTWHWVKDSHLPEGRTMPHVCRKWDSIDDWIKQRKINIYQPGLLVHPTFGGLYLPLGRSLYTNYHGRCLFSVWRVGRQPDIGRRGMIDNLPA